MTSPSHERRLHGRAEYLRELAVPLDAPMAEAGVAVDGAVASRHMGAGAHLTERAALRGC
jgi:hypothetical protein